MSIALNITDRDGARQVVLGSGSVVIGGGEECDIPLGDPTVSRRHLSLQVDGYQVSVEDLGSTNGSTLAGVALRPGASKLWPASVPLRLGDTELTWSALGDNDDSPVVELAAPAVLSSDRHEAEATQRSSAPHSFLSKQLPTLLEAAIEADRLTLGRAVGEALVAASGATDLLIEDLSAAPPATLFTIGTVDDAASGETHSQLRVRTNSTDPDARSLLAIALRIIALARGQAASPDTQAKPALPMPESLEPAVRQLYETAAMAARAGLNVLIQGETGAGKEVLARFIREQQESGEAGWITINCAALPESLLEAELFGIEKGVATGVEARAGLFEQANGGVLFLDEIADMSLGMQAKILRVLEERRVRRVGGRTLRPAAVQLVAASNQSLRERVESGRFRRDLFHRLADWVATIPSLADRPRDIANLASYFLARAAGELEKPIRGLTRGAIVRLLAHDWPGNVRELQREMHRVAAFAPHHAVVTASDLAPGIGLSPGESRDLASQLLRHERRIIARALAIADDDIDAAAEALGISRSTFYRRLRATGLGSPQSQD